MPRLVEVQARPNHRLWLRYDDGASGEVDVSHLVGRGVFTAWEQPGAFESVSLGPGGEVAWGAYADLCPDSLYIKLTGRPAEEVLPGLSSTRLSA